MKIPGKRLIVEYKNRRARKDVKSLWGDINLRAIAREVEEDVLLPQDKKQADDVISAENTDARLSTPQVEELQPARENIHEDSTQAALTAGDTGKSLPALEREDDGTVSVQSLPPKEEFPASRQTDDVADRIVLVEKTPEMKKAVAAPKVVRRKTRPNQTTHPDKQPQAAAFPALLIQNDELASLEAENKQLKLLLIKQLRAENRQLSRMIARADQPIATK